MDLTEKQWERLSPLLPAANVRGRPRRDNRDVLNAILWILRTGAPWKDLPERYPPYQTCHRRLQEWTKTEVMPNILGRLAQDLHEQGDIDLSEYFIDGTFASAKKGVSMLVKLKRVKVQNLWPSQTVLVFRSPLAHALLAATKSSLLTALLAQGLSPIYQNDL